MIFVTVGTQFPFDRLVKAVDEWAGKAGRGDVFAQVGPSQYSPHSIQKKPFISPVDFAKCTAEAALIVSHAGMGSILTAMEVGKPIIVMPRLASLGEHRNDHQLSTAIRFREIGSINVAMNERELIELLDVSMAFDRKEKISPYASSELISCISRFIESKARE